MELIETAKTWLADNREWLGDLATLTAIIAFLGGAFAVFKKFFSQHNDKPTAQTVIVENNNALAD